MPEKKSPHLWIWITISLVVVIVLVVIFIIRDQQQFNTSASVVDFNNATVPDYNYSEQDRIRIEKEMAESNELFADVFSAESSNEVENTQEIVVDPAEKEKIQQNNEVFMNMFNQSNL